MADEPTPLDPPARSPRDTLEDEWFAEPAPGTRRPPPAARPAPLDGDADGDVDPLDRWFA